MNYYKLYFTILLAGLTLFLIIDNVYKYRISKAEIQANEFLMRNIPKTPTKKEDFDAQLQRAMDKHRRLQKAKEEKYQEDNKDNIAVCTYFSDIYKQNRTKENELKFFKACDVKSLQ